MPDHFLFFPDDPSVSHNQIRNLLKQADEAQALDDRDECVALIKQVFDAFDLKSSGVAQLSAAMIIGLSGSWIGDLVGSFFT